MIKSQITRSKFQINSKLQNPFSGLSSIFRNLRFVICLEFEPWYLGFTYLYAPLNTPVHEMPPLQTTHDRSGTEQGGS